MQISVTTRADDIVLVTLVGRMDALGADKIAIAFTAATATRRALVVVDLGAVDFLASAGLRQFFANARAQHRRGGALVLAEPQPDVRAVLDSTGVQQAIPVFGTVDEAVVALRGRAAGTP
jgi:anti-anti-sigma factor